MNENHDRQRGAEPQVTDRRKFFQQAGAALAATAFPGAIAAGATPAAPAHSAAVAGTLTTWGDAAGYLLDLGDELRRRHGLAAGPLYGDLVRIAAAHRLTVEFTDRRPLAVYFRIGEEAWISIPVACTEVERTEHLAWALAKHLADRDGVTLPRRIGKRSVTFTSLFYAGLLLSGLGDRPWEYRRP